ncbi:MAG: guanylate kinase [Flavobacteriales bacterium]
MSKGKAIIFSAPSGAGKTTLVHHLLGIDDLRLSFSVSATTRVRRGHELDGKDYHFMDVDTFLDKAKNGDFVEWEEVYNNQFYGTLKSEIEGIWSNGRNVIFDVDVLGGINLKKIFGGDAFSVFVRPPSLEVLRFRLRNRSTETSEKIAMRIEKAQSELAYEDQFDTVIVNDILEDALLQAEMKVRQFLSQ